MEAFLGLPAIAVSLVGSELKHFDTAARAACSLIERLKIHPLPADTILNVNVPDVSAEELKGIKICSQANGFWKEEFQKRQDPMGRDYYWLTGFFHNREPNGGGEGTDEWALEQHYASVVPINTDLTAHVLMDKIRHWEKAPVQNGSQ